MKLLKFFLDFVTSLRLVNVEQRLRDQYLAGASNLAELEERQRVWARGTRPAGWY